MDELVHSLGKFELLCIGFSFDSVQNSEFDLGKLLSSFDFIRFNQLQLKQQINQISGLFLSNESIQSSLLLRVSKNYKLRSHVSERV